MHSKIYQKPFGGSRMEERVRRFLRVETGDGSGCSSGEGSDSGSGYGYGYGYGYGDGSSYGYGAGSGNGSGSGNSSGSGDSDGSGYGSGSGSGSGSDDDSERSSSHGIVRFNDNLAYFIDGIATSIEQIRGNLAIGYIISSDLTLEPCYIARYGDYFAHGKTAKKAVEDAKTKAFSSMDIDSKIEEFIKLFGEGKHSGHECFKWHGILTGSCELGRSEFVKEKGIDLDGKYTMEEFVAMVKDSYGDEIIKKLIPT